MSERANPPTSYRFDPDTLRLIEQLREVLRDPETGRRRTATDVIRRAVRELARRHVPKPTK